MQVYDLKRANCHNSGALREATADLLNPIMCSLIDGGLSEERLFIVRCLNEFAYGYIATGSTEDVHVAFNKFLVAEYTNYQEMVQKPQGELLTPAPSVGIPDEIKPTDEPKTPIPVDSTVEVKASPKAIEEAKSLGIDLSKVAGTGKDGNITVNDVRAHKE